MEESQIERKDMNTMEVEGKKQQVAIVTMMEAIKLRTDASYLEALGVGSKIAGPLAARWGAALMMLEDIAHVLEGKPRENFPQYSAGLEILRVWRTASRVHVSEPTMSQPILDFYWDAFGSILGFEAGLRQVEHKPLP